MEATIEASEKDLDDRCRMGCTQCALSLLGHMRPSLAMGCLPASAATQCACHKSAHQPSVQGSQQCMSRLRISLGPTAVAEVAEVAE